MNRYPILIFFFLLHLASLFSFFPERILGSASEGHWEAILLGCLLEMFMLWMYLKAVNLFPGKNIIDICKETVGNWGARLILLPLLLFMFFHLVLAIHYETDEISSVLLPQTPTSVISFVAVAVSFYAAWKGIFVIVRTGIALFILFMPFVLFSLFISAVNFDYHNLFPIWDFKMAFLIKPDYYISLLAYSGFLFLGLVPLSKPISYGKLIPAMLMVVLFGLAVVYVPLLVFGQEAVDNFQYPSLMASDTIDLEWVVFDWLPTFYVVSTSAISTLQTAVLLWMAVLLIRLLFIPVNDKWIVSGVAIIAYICNRLIPNIRVFNGYYLLNTFFCLYSIICIPIIIVILATLGRKKVLS